MHYEPKGFKHLSAAQVKSDTLNIILCNRIHERLNIKDRALKIARACRFTQARTKDTLLYSLCSDIIKLTNGKQYLKVIGKADKAENKYNEVYK
tara:strand:- start:833 stop:1114 length:282 start_codon:yes stop_codon:yes gene_type:complete